MDVERDCAQLLRREPGRTGVGSARIFAASVALTVREEVNDQSIRRSMEPLGPSQLRASLGSDPTLLMAGTTSRVPDVAVEDAIAKRERGSHERRWWESRVDAEAQVGDWLPNAFRFVPASSDRARGGEAD